MSKETFHAIGLVIRSALLWCFCGRFGLLRSVWNRHGYFPCQYGDFAAFCKPLGCGRRLDADPTSDGPPLRYHNPLRAGLARRLDASRGDALVWRILTLTPHNRWRVVFAMDTVKVAIIGFGTIGSGVARLLLEHGDRIARQAGKRLELIHVVDTDLKRSRNFTLPPGVLTADLAQVTDNREIVAAIELVGGLEPARTIVLKLLESGKDVVTANKALLAEHGPELFDKARRLGRSIAFEAAVAGGIPIIAAIGECLTANQVESIHAILNGTSNFILSQMEENNTDYASALAEAQQRGYAEANPAMDINGSDAAQKLAILAHLAFGAGQLASGPAHGDRHRRRRRYALRQGTRLQHQAVGRRRACARGARAARLAHAGAAPHAAGRSPWGLQRRSHRRRRRRPGLLPWAGAGQMPTASAVVADLINTVAGRTAITFRMLNLWSSEGEPPVRPATPTACPAASISASTSMIGPG